MAGRKQDPSNSGDQTADGKFAPGNKLGKGRPEGSRNKATLACQELLDGDAEALTKTAIELAKGGDIQALRLCLDRLLPPRKDRPLVMDVPDIQDIGGLADASAVVLQSVVAGEITPSEGQALSSILESRRKVIELTDIERRVEEIERKQGKR